MRNLLKPLDWLDLEGLTIATTLAYEYQLTYQDNKLVIAYFNLNKQSTEPKKVATGFDTEEEAKKWAFNHHVKKMMPYLNTDPLTQILNWFKTAKPEPTDKDKLVQIGCHFEEVGEMNESILSKDTWQMEKLANHFKTADYLPDQLNKLELLDALADQIVTAMGVGYMMGFDMIGALNEVNASNYSKFVDGKAITDDNGKIIKSGGYRKPELSKFLGVDDE